MQVTPERHTNALGTVKLLKISCHKTMSDFRFKVFARREAPLILNGWRESYKYSNCKVNNGEERKADWIRLTNMLIRLVHGIQNFQLLSFYILDVFISESLIRNLFSFVSVH